MIVLLLAHLTTGLGFQCGQLENGAAVYSVEWSKPQPFSPETLAWLDAWRYDPEDRTRR